jgi:hypothetical protein
MKLYCNGDLIGSLTTYFYETPWASAQIEPVDAELYERLCRASYFLSIVLNENWGELTEKEENRVYAQHLAELQITDADLVRFQGTWEIRESDHPDRQGVISLYTCDPDHWVTWRW